MAFYLILGKNKSVSMFILRKNEVARRFWRKVFMWWRTQVDIYHYDPDFYVDKTDLYIFFLPTTNKRLRQIIKVWNQYRYIEKCEETDTHKLAVVAALRQRALNKVLYDGLQNGEGNNGQ